MKLSREIIEWIKYRYECSLKPKKKVNNSEIQFLSDLQKISYKETLSSWYKEGISHTITTLILSFSAFIIITLGEYLVGIPKLIVSSLFLVATISNYLIPIFDRKQSKKLLIGIKKNEEADVKSIGKVLKVLDKISLISFLVGLFVLFIT